MIEYKKNCKVCSTLKGLSKIKKKKLIDRIYMSTFYNPTGEESLTDIHKAHKNDFSYDSLKNHVKKHQFISEDAKDEALLNRIQTKSEEQVLAKLVGHVDVRDLVMSKGYEGIEEGTIKLRASDVLTAARDQKNYEEKKVDQQLAMMEMVYHYTSGEATKSHAYDNKKLKGKIDGRLIEGQAAGDNDSTQEPTGDIDSLPPRPGTVQHRTVGYAPPQGTNRVPDQD